MYYYEKIEFWKDLLIFTGLIFTLHLILNLYRNRLNTFILDNRMYNWLISKKDLVTISDEKFEKWCAFLLKRLGYNNIKIVSERYQGGKDIICSKDKQMFYVVCIRNSIKNPDFEDETLDIYKTYSIKNNKNSNIPNDVNLNDDGSYEKLGRPFVQEFMGLMYHDKISNGIILSTGYFSTPAIEYSSTLPNDYKIELIDGDNLTLKHWQLLKNRV
jgi:hypothetical protein